VARVGGVSLLFDRDRVRSIHHPSLRGVFTVEQALSMLLQDTGLVAKRIGPDTYVLVPATPVAEPPPEPAIPDILVIGTRTQDTDIRRREDDVQPYRVLTSARVADAQSGTTDEFLRSRVASNQVSAPTVQQPSAGGKAQSSINLRGLGTAQTLILIDGRRIASVPTINAFLQSDITGLPLAAVERIETYGGTAGGLYGPGAIGGVVNIVLKQHLPRFWIEGQSGIDSRGDGLQGRISGGISVASRDDRTQLNATVSYSKDDGLSFSARDFVSTVRHDLKSGMPLGQNVNVGALDGQLLTLVAALGGQSLGSAITNIPVNSGGSSGNEAALLRAGAGNWDYRLSADGNGSKQNLLTPLQTSAVIINARQKVGERFELFGNFLMMTDRGTTFTPTTDQTYFTLAPGQFGNPFQNAIKVAVPTPGIANPASARFRTLRATVGLIAHLPAGWSVEGDATYGTSTDADMVTPETVELGEADVFTPGDALARKLATLEQAQRYTAFLSAKMSDVNLHLSGQLFAMPGGPATLTLSGEYRTELSATLRQTPALEDYDTKHGQTVSSLLGEARLPVESSTSPFILLRGLELQLAARADRYRIDLPADYLGDKPDDGSSVLSSRGTTVAFTIGAKVKPVRGLMLRASFATGFQPPAAGDLVAGGEDEVQVTDPKRPNDGIDHYVSIITGGSPTLKPELAKTLSIGVVVEPTTVAGLRISVDYTRILTLREITEAQSGDYDYFIAHEADYPGRIVRAPLTAADIARGYTGGAIVQIDTGALNSGRSVFQAVDLDFAYSHDFGRNSVAAYLSATWIPSYLRSGNPYDSPVQYARQSDGPLTWKGVGGLNWRRGAVGATIDLQYYGGYDVTVANQQIYFGSNLARIEAQGGRTIPSQTFVDIGFDYRLKLGGSTAIKYRVGIKNIFDRLPPLVIPQLYGSPATWPGYSTYGDPRGRRFVLTISANL